MVSTSTRWGNVSENWIGPKSRATEVERWKIVKTRGVSWDCEHWGLSPDPYWEVRGILPGKNSML